MSQRTFNNNLNLNGLLNSNNTTDSTSTSTGSITTLGGVGIAKSLVVGLGSQILGPSTFSGIPSSQSILLNPLSGGNSAVKIVSAANTNNSYIDFSYINNDYKGRILYNHSTDTFNLYNSSSSTSSLTLDSSGNLTTTGYHLSSQFATGNNNSPKGSVHLRNASNPTINNFIVEAGSYSDNSNVGVSALNFNGFFNTSDTTINASKNRWRILVNQNAGNDSFSIDTYNNSSTSTLISFGTNLVTTFNTSTASTSSSAGAVVLSGGLSINNSTNASSTTNGGSLTTAGGASIAKNLYIGGSSLIINNTSNPSTQITDGTNTLTLGLVTSAGNFSTSSAVGDLVLRSDTSKNVILQSGTGSAAISINSSNVVNILTTTASSSSSTGAFISAGGIAVSNTTDATSASSGGAMTIAGGAAIAKSLYVGGTASFNTINMNSTKITNLLDPTQSSDAATKNYVDAIAQGLSVKNSVVAATTQAQTLTTDFQNGSVIDGVTLATGNRILVKNQSSAIENGIYIVQASGVPTRSSDFASGSSEAGTFTFVELGTVNASNGFVVTNAIGSDVVGTNGITFTQFSGSGTVTAGQGLTKTGNTLSVNASQTQITQVGTLTSLTVSGATNGVSLNLSGLTASQAVFTDSSKNLVSVATTGSGNSVLATSPSLTTPNIGAATATSLTIGSSTLTTTGNDLYLNASSNSVFIRNTAGSANGQFQSSTSTFTFANSNNTVNVLSINKSTNASTFNGVLSITDATASTSNSTGSVTLSGGLGIALATDATSSTNGGSITTAGGFAVAKKIISGSSITASAIGTGTGNTSPLGSAHFRDPSNTSNNNIIIEGGNVADSSITGLSIINFNSYYNSGQQRINTSKNAWRIKVDQSSTNDNLAIDTYNGTTNNVLMQMSTNTSILFPTNTSIGNGNSIDGSTNIGSININGDLTLYNSTKNTIAFNSNGLGNPTFNTRSSGAKIVLFPAIGASNTDFAIGMSSSVMWHSVNTTASTFAFYHGTTNTVNLNGTNMTLTYTTASTSNSTGSIISSGGIGISLTTDATSSTNGGTFTTAGGLAVAKSAYIGTSLSVGTNLSVTGTVTSGTWNGATIAVAYGGTGASTLTTNAVLLGNGTSAIQTTSSLTYSSSILSLPGLTSTTTTASSSATTGAVLLSGGLSISLATDATSSTNGGTITTAGGLAVAKSAYIGTSLTAGTNVLASGFVKGNSFSGTSGQGAYLGWNRTGTGTTVFANQLGSGTGGWEWLAYSLSDVLSGSVMTLSQGGGLNLSGTTASTSNVTGIFTISGGIGISLTTDASSATNGGTFTTAGGIAVNKSSYLNGVVHINSAAGASGSQLIISPTTNGGGSAVAFYQNTAESGNVWTLGNSNATTTGNFGLWNSVGGLTLQATSAGLVNLPINTSIANGNTFDGSTNVGTLNANGDITLYNSTKNTIAFNTAGAAAPTFTTRSAGTKIVLFPGITASAADYAIGISASTMWHSVSTTSSIFAFYHGTTNTINFNGTNMTLTYTTASTSNSTGSIISSGGIGISLTTDASSSTNGGSITTAGGLAVAKSAYIGTTLSVGSTLSVTGNLISLTSGVAPNYSLSNGSATANFAMATGAGQFSTSAVSNDTIIRGASGANLILQSGASASALTITSGNIVNMPINTSIGNGNSVDGATNIGTLNTNGDITLYNGTKNTIAFAGAGLGVPTFTTRSAGTKIVLFPAVSGSSIDYGIGIASGVMWHSVNTTASTFAFYHGTTNTVNLNGSNMVLNYTADATSYTAGGSIITSGGVSIAKSTYTGTSALFNCSNNGALIVATTLSNYNAGLWASTQNSGLQIGWNNVSGTGATDFLNNGQGSSTGPAFNFWFTNSANTTAVRISQIAYTGAYTTVSDYRLKSNVTALSEEFTVDNLRPVSYIHKNTQEKDIGFIAHEVQEHFPELVYGEKDCKEYQTLSYSGLIPILVAEIQRMKKRIEELEKR